MVRIEGKLNGEIDVKRFYLEGIKMTSKCPKCGKEAIFDGDSDYLSYPKANEIDTVCFYCGNCDDDWLEKIKLKISIVPVKEIK